PHRFNRQLAADVRSAHIRFELKRGTLPPPFPAVFPAYEPAGLQSRTRANYNIRLVLPGTNLRGHTARSVAGNFRLGTIRIDQARLDVSFRIGKQPFHAISANSAMAIAQTAAERAQVAGSLRTFHHQKIVAASRRLGKRNTRALLRI